MLEVAEQPGACCLEGAIPGKPQIQIVGAYQDGDFEIHDKRLALPGQEQEPIL